MMKPTQLAIIRQFPTIGIIWISLVVSTILFAIENMMKGDLLLNKY